MLFQTNDRKGNEGLARKVTGLIKTKKSRSAEAVTCRGL